MTEPKKNVRAAVLDAAERAVNGSRQAVYAGPEQNFARIRDLWNTHIYNRTGQISTLTSTDVATMLVLVKIARLAASPSHLDSWIDIAGYAACGAEVAGCEVDVS